jgi:hypothetical protein
MSSIDYPPLVERCNVGETPRMPTPESIGLRDTVHQHKSRFLGFQATPNQKKFQASDCSLAISISASAAKLACGSPMLSSLYSSILSVMNSFYWIAGPSSVFTAVAATR